MNILELSITVFFTQIVFIGSRVINIRAIAKNNIAGALVSGAVIHIAWLISIAIGATSMNAIIADFEWKYVPIVICSLSGGLLGTYWSMKASKN